MDRPWGHYAKWNKSDKGRQILCDLTYMWSLKKQTENKTKLIDTDWWLTEARAGVGQNVWRGSKGTNLHL